MFIIFENVSVTNTARVENRFFSHHPTSRIPVIMTLWVTRHHGVVTRDEIRFPRTPGDVRPMTSRHHDTASQPRPDAKVTRRPRACDNTTHVPGGRTSGREKSNDYHCWSPRRRRSDRDRLTATRVAVLADTCGWAAFDRDNVPPRTRARSQNVVSWRFCFKNTTK